MRQSRRLSLVEAAVNVALGYGLALLAQALLFPLLGLAVTLAQSLQIGLAFTLLSLARAYVLRRLFERFAGRGRV